MDCVSFCEPVQKHKPPDFCWDQTAGLPDRLCCVCAWHVCVCVCVSHRLKLWLSHTSKSHRSRYGDCSKKECRSFWNIWTNRPHKRLMNKVSYNSYWRKSVLLLWSISLHFLWHAVNDGGLEIICQQKQDRFTNIQLSLGRGRGASPF